MPKRAKGEIRVCSGCDNRTTSFRDYGSFVLCTGCDREIIEDEERANDAEVAAIVGSGRNVWEM